MTLTAHELSLAKRAVRGDRTALERLLAGRGDYLYRTAYLYVGNEQDALECLQEATTQAVVAVRHLREPALFVTWFTRILIRQAQRVYTLRASETPTLAVGEQAPAPPADLEQHVDLLAAFTQLKAEYRQTLQLFYYQDLPIREISRLLNTPEATIKTRLRRGRAALKTILGGDYYG
ncbi:sigma-70 family RNA polymerase sigma factor [Lacticaseibacillus absianus]|uniref:sigma-70 family RNA polymerase sigma factor n=1 Tax=Lacticaseibacillus absianus TaxID=2729623 RepID=UPI0015CC8A6A|nr:sigma-70 family RNA polymerase sigma factor [Lacticaseibacillus absianus]